MCAYAEAVNVMSTQSKTEFQWSVKLIGTSYFRVGIASQIDYASHLERSCDAIEDQDQNAIVYKSYGNESMIKVGTNTIHSDLGTQNDGDIIRFRFQPQSKKLLIDAVSLW